MLFGQGRLGLLSALDELGSLSAAAKSLGMSYRAAWGRLKASEERLGLKLTQASGAGRGLVLSDEGKRLLDSYEEFERLSTEAITKIGRKVFDRDIEVLPSRDDTD